MQSNDNTATNELSVNCVLLPGNCTDQLHIHESVIIITSNIFPGERRTHTIYRETKKRELLKNPTKIEIQEKKFIDRKWTTCLLRDSNPNYQCSKIKSCRWHPPPHMHSFNLPLRFPIARCNISAGIPRISSWILCFNSSSVLGRVV